MADSGRQTHDQSRDDARPRHHRRRRVIVVVFVLLLVCLVAAGAVLYGYMNLSTSSDADFARRLDQAIDRANKWVQNHRDDIVYSPNIALVRMLQDASSLHHNELFDRIVNSVLSRRLRPDCWKRLLEADRNISEFEIRQTVEKEPIDNKWILYAIAPEMVKLTDEQREQFYDGRRWRGRQLTHQLWALVHLRQRKGSNAELDSLIEHICRRLTSRLAFALPVRDMYIQRTSFVLFAGHPEKIRRRWVERVIGQQNGDGSWDNRWYLLGSRSGGYDLTEHATIQALWLLYQVKYRYPGDFGLAERRSAGTSQPVSWVNQ